MFCFTLAYFSTYNSPPSVSLFVYISSQHVQIQKVFIHSISFVFLKSPSEPSNLLRSGMISLSL